MDLSKYINKLNTTDGWINALKELIDNAIEDSKRVVIIVIARKMARLFEYHLLIDPNLSRYLKDKPDVAVITEHAIPFCLKDADENNTEVVIVDDLIVYGDTVETVYENVLCFTGIKAKIIAMAASNKFRSSLLKKDVVHPNLTKLPNPDVISDNIIPAFTARNSWYIVSLCHPIDLEHTILRIKLKQIADCKEIAEKLRDILAVNFPEAVTYLVTHHNPISDRVSCSVSLVFKNENGDVINSDFSKVRFFIGPDEMRVVSYAPNIWESPIMEDESITLYNTPGLSDVWSILHDSLKSAISSTTELNEGDIDKMLIEQDFRNRVELSAIVMANYLVSFDSLCLKKKRIESVLSEVLDDIPIFEIAEEDISLIVGRNLAENIIPLLRNAFDCANSNIVVIDRTSLRPETLRKPLLPMYPETNYLEERILDILTQVNVNASLSLIFNRLSSDYGLVDKRREDRVKVGETYDSLYNSLSLHFKNDNLFEALHRWIDSRIDLGVVVPKYEFFTGPLGYKIWRRYFRAGEREDILKNVARVAVLIATHKFGIDCQFSFSDFVSEVIPQIEQINLISKGQVNMDWFSDGLFLSGFPDRDYSFWIYLARLGVIRLTSSSDLKSGSVQLDDREAYFETTALF